MKKLKYLVTAVPLLITFLIWVEVQIRIESAIDLRSVLYMGGQLTGLFAVVLLAQSYVLATRIKLVENLFGGLDKSYKVHAMISKTGFALILLHPMLLAFSISSSFEGFLLFLAPKFNLSPAAFGFASLALYAILIALSIYRFLPYHVWKFTHQFIGVPFILAGYHAFNAGSTFALSPYMKGWMSFIVLAGLIAYLYKVVLYRWVGPRHIFTVVELINLGDKVEVYLKPIKQNFKFNAGEFVFLGVKNNKNIPKEQHPFTIASDPNKGNIKIAYKALGDYTKTLKSYLKVGDMIDIYGPYGHFSSQKFKNYKDQIWIAGGIGVTPFLSMLEYEVSIKGNKNIHFFYCSNDEKDAVYNDHIKQLSQSTKNIFFESYLADEKGKITAEYIVNKIKDDIKNKLILLCGPMPMMIALKKQFMQVGIKEDRIVFEEFNLV